MNNLAMDTNRRAFLKTSVLAAAGLAAGVSASAQTHAPLRHIKLGLDNFAVRAMNWNAAQLIDYAATLKTDSLFITDLKPFANFEDGYLKDLRKMAADKGLQIHLGSWSICPTSPRFKKDWGTAEEHLLLGLRMARALGSPVFRVVLGGGEDRLTPGGIEARIADTVKVCKACRSQALDSGVKIAVENHAGDMQAWELVTLIEAAGKDYVGANIDSGNATWTFEDPLENLEILGPYVVTTSLRDSAIWESANGATVQWTAMGEGTMDLKAYFDRFAQLCPGALGERLIFFTERGAHAAADGGCFGIGERELHVVAGEIGEGGDLLRVAGAHCDHGALADEGDDLADGLELPRIGDPRVVGGDEKIAALRHANLAEQRAGAAVLELHFDAEFFAVLRSDGLDGFL